MTKTATIISDTIGRKRIITRAEMETLLLALHEAGLDLSNAYVANSQKSPEIAAVAWAKSVEGITIISASIEGRGLGHSDGCVRYDQPGSMHPMQKAEVMFVPENIENAFQPPSYAREFMTRHADRTLIVRREEPVPVIPDPDAGKVRNVCDNGHSWMSLPNEEIQCPTCGEWSV